MDDRIKRDPDDLDLEDANSLPDEDGGVVVGVPASRPMPISLNPMTPAAGFAPDGPGASRFLRWPKSGLPQSSRKPASKSDGTSSGRTGP